eukprot:Em0019g606a
MAAAKRPGVQYRDSPLSKGPTIEAEDVPKDQIRRRSSEKRHSMYATPEDCDMNEGGKAPSEPAAPIYGELLVLGTNGCLPCPAISSKMSNYFQLKKQPKATGISPIIKEPGNADSLLRKSTHTVAVVMNRPGSGAAITEYGHDPNTDMFQIGRSADSAIDLVVVEMVAMADGTKAYKSNSTVSRYACRIQCERAPPYTARLYAAAFDTHSKIHLSAMAPTWSQFSGEYDGLTTNGVAFMRPTGVFESGVSPGEWREVTVMGNVRKLRAQRSSRTPGDPVPEETNILTDGCLIDLCGVTLMWRTAMGLEHGPSDTIMRERRQALNEKAPQCPVNFLTLHFRSQSAASTEESLREPWAYLKCGHIYSHHDWKAGSEENYTHRTCPMCLVPSPYIRLELGQERGFFIDNGELTHSFMPCGHVTTEKTTQYWKKVKIPHMATEWVPRCPFCSFPLDPTTPMVKLIFS